MGVFRIEKTKDYSVISNHHLKDKNLSLKAKGLLSMMLSLPDNWDYSVEGLVAICKESKTAIQSILKELEDFKYLKRNRLQNDKGQFEYEYNIFEIPLTEIPYTENPCTDNVSQYNTNKLNTNNKKEIYKEKNGFDEPYEDLVEHFEDIWAEYPNRKGKNQAFKHYFTWLKGKEYCGKKVKLTPRQMWYAVQDYNTYIKNNNIQPQYIKHGSTFFNNIIEFVKEDDE